MLLKKLQGVTATGHGFFLDLCITSVALLLPSSLCTNVLPDESEVIAVIYDRGIEVSFVAEARYFLLQNVYSTTSGRT
jgi:hypothetical protein